ncbi:MAG: chemoreceptor glutamine deamidase CheD [Alphaproteobacteria bacterium]|nr:chemoreceptor glutamine deamidase CheD [Alphaproteobacteria bacterium]
MNRTVQERRRKSKAPADKRYYDSRYGAHILKVLPGQYRMASEEDEMLVTVLGSCVAACIRDPRTGYGGMNHFMLPAGSDPSSWGGLEAAFRYGNYAMEVLINELMKAGCRKEDMEIKLFGGANVSNILSDVGERNIKFVRQYLGNEGLRPVAEDLGGDKPRRIHYCPFTGKVQRLLLRRVDDSNVIGNEESRYQKDIIQPKPSAGDVELFD